MLYRHQFVWLSSPCCAVIGWTLEELNNKIDEYNKIFFKYGNFFDWLSYETGTEYSGFSYWNNIKPVNPLVSKLHTIKNMEVKNNA